MLEWRPKRLLGTSIGVGAILAVLLLDGLLVYLLIRQPIGFTSFLLGLLVALSLPVLAVLGYLLYGLFTLRYLIGRDSLVISWARREEVIPLAAIETAVSARDLGEKIKVRGLRWPGYCLARGRGRKTGEVLFYSSDRVPDQLLIGTANASYMISPSNATGFLSALRARRTLGPAQELQQTREERGLLALPIWHDWVALGLLVSGAVANGSLFAYISARYPHLPELVPLLSEAGQVKLIGTKRELFQLPVIGVVVYVVNTVLGLGLHRWERLVTYSLAGVALLVQILFWAAVITLIR